MGARVTAYAIALVRVLTLNANARAVPNTVAITVVNTATCRLFLAARDQARSVNSSTYQEVVHRPDGTPSVDEASKDSGMMYNVGRIRNTPTTTVTTVSATCRRWIFMPGSLPRMRSARRRTPRTGST